MYSLTYTIFVRSGINRTLAVIIIILNLIIFSLNIYVIKKGSSPFEGEMNLSALLMVSNIFLIPAIITFFKNMSDKLIILMLNILGRSIAIPGTVMAFAMLSIQC